MTCWKIDSIVDFIEENHGKWSSYLMPALQGDEITEEGSYEWLDGYFGRVLPVIEKRLAENQNPFIGDTARPSIADFKAFQSLSDTLFNPASVCPQSVKEAL